MAEEVLTDYNARVDTMILDDANFLSSSRVDESIKAAAKLYSIQRPLIKVSEFSGDGGYDYDLPDDWKQGFSLIS